MKKADKRNIIAPSNRPSLRIQGNSPILSAAKLKAANVPGAEAFLIGFISFSNSSVIDNASKVIMPIRYTSSFCAIGLTLSMSQNATPSFYLSVFFLLTSLLCLCLPSLREHLRRLFFR
jgi:hypothetical protein